MRNTLILLVLVSIGLATPALAKGHEEDRSNHSEHRSGKMIKKTSSGFAHHDRGPKYDHFRNKMNNLRKELRHERRVDRREIRHDRREDRREIRHDRRVARYYGPRRGYSAPVVVASRRATLPLFGPQITLRIPLNW